MNYDLSDLRERVAVVTGGSGALCGAMAKELARHGARVVIISRTLENGQRVADAITAEGGDAIAIACDVLEADGLKHAAKRVKDTYGGCDILINGAGGGHPSGNTTHERLKPGDEERNDISTLFTMKPEGFAHVLDVNLLGTWLSTQAFARMMIGRPGATIVNISSMAAPCPATKVPAYSAAKAAIDNLTQWLAVHLVEVGIRVNAIAPGFFITEQNRKLLLNEDGSLTDRSVKIIDHTPMGRFGEPEDLLGTLLWLVNERTSRFVTGVTVPVDGGFMAYSGV